MGMSGGSTPIVTVPNDPWNSPSPERVIQRPKRALWAFGIAALEREEIKQLSTLSGPWRKLLL